MEKFIVSDAWKIAFPGAAAGILAMQAVSNPEHHAELDQRKAALEEQLRARYAGLDRPALLSLPVLKAYETYDKRFNKTYHVQLQLESVVNKGKAIPRVAALVEAMFMAELQNLLLTAGHDLETLRLPVRLEVARGDEAYTLMRGQPQVMKAGDMFIADAEGIISSVLYGPDARTQIIPATRQVFFAVYAPAGIAVEAVNHHLETIRDNILLFSPQARVELLRVVTGGIDP